MPISYLQIENLTKSVGDRMLFVDVTFGVNEGDKIGIVAKNGTGKTSLLRIIAGVDAPDSGTVTPRAGLRIAILEQVPQFEPEETVIEACLKGDNETARTVRDYELAMQRGDYETTSALSAKMDALGSWDYEDRARQMLTQCSITDFEAKVKTLSGGQRKRIALCRILIEQPDMLILDEPTNHLDIATIEWLEAYLSRSRMTLLMVTHDRYFLDRVCNKIIEIDNQQIYTYEGNYDYYLRRRRERIEAMTAELAKIKNTLRKEQEWMRRQPQARAGKAKYRIDAFYDLKERSRINLKENNVNLNVKAGYIGSKIFEADNVSKRYGEKVILDNFSYIFGRGEKVGIVGENGVGKSTFIKMLQGIVAPDSGQFDVGETVRFGYYSQDGLPLPAHKKVIDAITELAEEVVINDGVRFTPMQFLQHFLFTPADQQKIISTLSGGELARLQLAQVLMRSPNFLILDEPTNDLDIVTLGILEDYLRDFKGCLIIISHDRFFLDSTVDHLFVFQGDGVIKDFPGSYSEYREFLSQQSKLQREQAAKSADEKTGTGGKARTPSSRRLSFKERKELEQLTDEIEKLSSEKADIELIFRGEKSGDIDQASRRYDEIKSILDEKELRWLELSEIEA
ncbi:MAG: ABC-F family ATP-binding cassette domain-containing protein [Muribaculaceae bacterium]|nr:ABC-F family ATP-binding cassette domain-containing protein [Muribaculaceae bacterium]